MAVYPSPCHFPCNPLISSFSSEINFPVTDEPVNSKKLTARVTSSRREITWEFNLQKLEDSRWYNYPLVRRHTPIPSFRVIKRVYRGVNWRQGRSAATFPRFQRKGREEDPHKSFTSLNFRKIPSTSVIPDSTPVQSLPLEASYAFNRQREIDFDGIKQKKKIGW